MSCETLGPDDALSYLQELVEMGCYEPGCGEFGVVAYRWVGGIPSEFWCYEHVPKGPVHKWECSFPVEGKCDCGAGEKPLSDDATLGDSGLYAVEMLPMECNEPGCGETGVVGDRWITIYSLDVWCLNHVPEGPVHKRDCGVPIRKCDCGAGVSAETLIGALVRDSR